MDSVRFALFPFRAEVRGLAVAGPRPGDPPFLEVPLIVAAPSLRPLAERRLDLYELRVVGPRIRVRAFEGGGDDIPRPRLGPRGAAEVRVRRLVVEGGELWVEPPARAARPRPAVVRGPPRAGRSRACSAGGSPSGPATPASARPRPSRWPPPWTSRCATGWSASRPRACAARGPTSCTAGRCASPRPIRADLELSGAVDLGDRGPPRARHRASTSRGRGTSRAGPASRAPHVRLGGRLSGTDGRFDGIDVSRYAGDVAWDASGVHLKRFCGDVPRRHRRLRRGRAEGPGAGRRCARACAAWTPSAWPPTCSTSGWPASARAAPGRRGPALAAGPLPRADGHARPWTSSRRRTSARRSAAASPGARRAARSSSRRPACARPRRRCA